MKNLDRIIREEIEKFVLNESANALDNKMAANMILNSIPGLKGFKRTKENMQAIKAAKRKDVGFWLFAEWFMKQRNPERAAMGINYIGDENAIASWEIRKPENGDPDVFWIIDVQSKQKGGFTEIMRYVESYCKMRKIQYIGLCAYNDSVKSMYINKFGFKEADWFLLKNLKQGQK